MKQLTSIQCLRGVAALMVVCLHASVFAFAQGRESPAAFYTLGNAGVDVFFVISGLVMWLSTCASRKSPSDFLRDRAVRIAPLYYLATATFATLIWVIGQHRVSVGDVLSSAFFIPHQNSINGQPMPILGVGWTLNYEAWFYLMFAGALLLPSSRRIPALLGAFTALAALRPLLHSNEAFLLRISSPLWFEFGFGMVIGAAAQAGRLPRARIGLLLAAFGILALLVIHHVRPGFARTLGFGVPAAFIVAGSASLEAVFRGRWASPLKALGDVSYSLYLIHVLWIEVLQRLIGTALPPVVTFAVALCGAVALAFASFHLIERPLLVIMKKPRNLHALTPVSARAP